MPSFYLASPLGRWGIELKENGKFIGTIDLLDLDLSLKKGSIGYVLNKDYWNQGLATEATKAVIALAFEQLGMNKLIAVHDQDTSASGTGDGQIRDEIFSRGALRDARPA